MSPTLLTLRQLGVCRPSHLSAPAFILVLASSSTSLAQNSQEQEASSQQAQSTADVSEPVADSQQQQGGAEPESEQEQAGESHEQQEQTLPPRPHRVELDATIGYRFGGSRKVSSDLGEGRLVIDDSLAFGGIVGVRVQPNGFVYLSYSRQQTSYLLRPADTTQEVSGRGSVEYFQFGGNLEAHQGFYTPYFGVSVGAARFASFDTGRSAVRLSAVLDAGVKFELLRFLHLRLLARLPFSFASGKLYCHSDYGCAVVVGSSPMVQGEVHAGLGLQF